LQGSVRDCQAGTGRSEAAFRTYRRPGKTSGRKRWIDEEPNPPPPFPKREGGGRILPSPLRGGVGEGRTSAPRRQNASNSTAVVVQTSTESPRPRRYSPSRAKYASEPPRAGGYR
jgi:hypothetical protein